MGIEDLKIKSVSPPKTPPTMKRPIKCPAAPKRRKSKKMIVKNP